MARGPVTRADVLREQAAAWRFFHDLFRLPTPEQWEWLRGEVACRAWRILAKRLKQPDDLPLPATRAEYEARFLAAFEVGAPHPPCPLIESHWNRRAPVPKVLHECMMFYRRFGLELRSTANETADHLRHQTEFLHYLCLSEARAIEEGRSEEAEQLNRGRADFLSRRLAWVPSAAEHIASVMPRQWPSQWVALLAAYSTLQPLS